MKPIILIFILTLITTTYNFTNTQTVTLEKKLIIKRGGYAVYKLLIGKSYIN